MAFGVEKGNVKLGGGVALLGSLQQPFRRLGIVLRYAPAVGVENAKLVLGKALPCSAAFRYHFPCFRQVLGIGPSETPPSPGYQCNLPTQVYLHIV